MEDQELDAPNSKCVLCEESALTLARRGSLNQALRPEHFAVTDAHYGVTTDIYRCSRCGFLQCAATPDPLDYYQSLEDMPYEEGRKERGLQMRKLLKVIAKRQSSGRLLDIGAASGILVEEALAMGFEADGIEPCLFFQQRARERDLTVHLGTFPHPAVTGPFEVVTLIDVLEHVRDPVGLLRATHKVLGDDGIGVVVTPDVSSLAARIMGWRWWHYRVAHLGYFNRKTLLQALDRAELEPIAVKRPGWAFAGDYLLARLLRYFPQPLRFSPPKFLRRIVVPLNLRDSLMVLFRRKVSPA